MKLEKSAFEKLTDNLAEKLRERVSLWPERQTAEYIGQAIILEPSVMAALTAWVFEDVAPAVLMKIQTDDLDGEDRKLVREACSELVCPRMDRL